jgi:hypothetical protein
MQRPCKHAFPTENLFSGWSVQIGYKEMFSWEVRSSSVSSLETPACRESLGAEKLNWVQSSELVVAE